VHSPRAKAFGSTATEEIPLKKGDTRSKLESKAAHFPQGQTSQGQTVGAQNLPVTEAAHTWLATQHVGVLLFFPPWGSREKKKSRAPGAQNPSMKTAAHRDIFF
jgi:anti-sigma factor RsiW